MLDTTGIVFKAIPPNSPIPDLLIKSVGAWRAFCALPLKTKKRFDLSQHETDWADPGYWNKNEFEGHDKKEYFHVMAHITQLLASEGVPQCVWPKEAREFLSISLLLLEHLVKILTETSYGLCENDSLAARIKRELLDSIDLFTLRFLKYDTAAFGDIIAKAHPDKCGLTNHLDASGDGLQYIPRMDTRDRSLPLWHDMPLSKDHMVLYSGLQMIGLSKGRIKPVIHQVVQAGPTQGSRESVVLFMPFISQPRQPRNKRVTESMRGAEFVEVS